MTKLALNTTNTVIQARQDEDINARVQRSMAIAVALSVMVAAVVAPWRIGFGLLLGGLLSLLSYRWMISSIAAAFDSAAPGSRPEINLAKYVVRYFVVGLAVYVAYSLQLVSLPATITGLCSFVVALFVEAIREFYFAIVHREEIG